MNENRKPIESQPSMAVEGDEFKSLKKGEELNPPTDSEAMDKSMDQPGSGDDEPGSLILGKARQVDKNDNPPVAEADRESDYEYYYEEVSDK